MESSRRSFTRESAEHRREALIRATLTLIGRKGVQAATVRSIAEEAGVTLGLIRHYFDGKDELIYAAYQAHMSQLTDATMDCPRQAGEPAAHQLARIVRASLTPPVSSPQAVGLWAGFLNMVQRDPRMAEVHSRTYYDFRDRLQALIAPALEEAGETPSPEQLRALAIACNAVIDGLWLEGGALPEAFDPGELVNIGLTSVGAILGLTLNDPGEEA
ncbi:transcriptional regulator, TetR family (plasmid) [Ruegeria pomeroyi DSS-3]|uniref:Transcriptional regulator, TetR family n=2 Tax=Ruegeria pomeroyi TaxID=89184 RepID=Q5LLG0_RUEPO|nr:TetR family transcriptional regulator C-terminal domain-containing protein [Ruegeria pomeroyi]AAV97207.1 transcriptional regulator, TetR family [Ruegeria pomeroyi DSS-3]NVK95603.1 TetR family transcriptional regulator C-terminal domain-containing protein [Ruegeria pomeroyi]NVL00338.1 TetR family transcriptional regulator C-terminal domain-containing protein [Ruegeria pomeroyi]